MNIHHLELFYYVARHGGIVPAVRNMPYGIQQPAASVRKHFPVFRLTLHEAARAEAERLLQAGEIDLAVTVIERKKASGVRSRALLELPLILLVKATQRLTRADELWAQDKIEETLITFRRSDPVAIHFQLGLQQLGVEWFSGIEVNSARLIEC